MRGRGFFGLLAVALVVSGCAATGPKRLSFPAEKISVPDRTGVYSTAVRPDGAVGPGVAAVEQDVQRTLSERGAKPQADGALADAASFLLREVNENRTVGPATLEAAAQQFGFAGTPMGYATFEAGSDTWKEVLGQVPANLPINRYGIRTSPSGRIAALVLGNVELSYEPIARSYEPNQAVTLKGELGPRYKFGHVYLTKPDGSVEEKLLPGRAFDLTFQLTAAGQYRLEVMGDGTMGPQIASNVPLYVGVPEPPLSGGSGKMMGAAEAEQRLLALTNEARRRAGAPPLALDDELREVALAHSEDMADHDFVGHVSPTTGTPEDRLKRSGILVADFGENIAQADSPEGAHDGLMNSPGHRAVLLKPQFTHVGIGVIEKPRALLVTFNFGRRVPAASLPKGATEVEAAIAALRAKKGLPAARIDPVYRAGAQAGAVALADGDDDEDVSKAIGAGVKREVNRLRSNRGAACSYFLQLLELGQLDGVPLLVHPSVRSLGVGTKMRTDGKGSRLSTVILLEGAPCR